MSISGNTEQNTAKNQNLNGNFLSVRVWPNARGIKACVNGVGNLEPPFLSLSGYSAITLPHLFAYPIAVHPLFPF